MQETTVNEAVENETKQPAAENRCPNCQALLSEGQTFCPECGAPLKKLCQKCGAELQEGQAFCAKCGQRADGTIDANASSAINQFNTNVAVQQQKNKRIPVIIGGVCVAVVAVALIFGKVGGGVDFEKKFADYIGVDYGLCCVNGTTSIQAGLFAVGVGAGDEVIVP